MPAQVLLDALDRPAPARPAEPRGDGFAIQVTALSGKTEAEAAADRAEAERDREAGRAATAEATLECAGEPEEIPA